MKTSKVLDQLRRVSDEEFVAAGKFAPRGVVAGVVAGGALGSVVGSKVRNAVANRDGTGIDLPRVLYLALTESDLHLVEGSYGVTVTPKRLLTSWPRAGVSASTKGGVRNVRVELSVTGLDRPIELLFTRGDTAAEDVVSRLRRTESRS